MNAEPEYRVVQCPQCNKFVPFDCREQSCFCLYCGTKITFFSQDEPTIAKDDNEKRTFDNADIIGVVQDEYQMPPRGIVVTTELENSVSLQQCVLFINTEGTCIGQGEIIGIEYNKQLLSSAQRGMSVGLLVDPYSLHDLVGSILIFDRWNQP